VLRRFVNLVAALIIVGATPLFAKHASAEDLWSALAAAYEFDPKLEAERARVRAADETLAQARAGYRPKLNAGVDLSWQTSNTDPSSASDGNVLSKSYSLSLSQPVFDGFQTDSAAAQAKAEIAAAGQDLRSAEQETLLQAVQAYVSVVHGRRIAELRNRGIGIFKKEVQSIRKRVEAGELIEADVDRARARLAKVTSDHIAAVSSLDSDLAEFARVIGHEAGTLKAPRIPLEFVPKLYRDAEVQTLSQHPAVLAAKFRAEGAQSAVKRVFGRLLPQVNLDANLREVFSPSGGTDRQETASVSGRMTVPLYEGGEVAAQIRQAKHILSAARSDVARLRLSVLAILKKAWSQLSAARAELNAGATQIEASKSALAGLRKGEQAGQRTPLEVLDAEQELLDAQVSAEHANIRWAMAVYELVVANGRMSVEQLSLPTTVYDPQANYLATQWKVTGLDIAGDDRGYRELIRE
jgi:outer membrane protein